MTMTIPERDGQGRPASTPDASRGAAATAANSVPLEERTTLREEVVGRERERFGGFKFGSAFFGWLAATGTAVILTALVAAMGAAIGIGATEEAQASLDEGDTTTIGIPAFPSTKAQ
jgi:hypothetical protein